MKNEAKGVIEHDVLFGHTLLDRVLAYGFGLVGANDPNRMSTDVGAGGVNLELPWARHTRGAFAVRGSLSVVYGLLRKHGF